MLATIWWVIGPPFSFVMSTRVVNFETPKNKNIWEMSHFLWAEKRNYMLHFVRKVIIYNCLMSHVNDQIDDQRIVTSFNISDIVLEKLQNLSILYNFKTDTNGIFRSIYKWIQASHPNYVLINFDLIVSRIDFWAAFLVILSHLPLCSHWLHRPMPSLLQITRGDKSIICYGTRLSCGGELIGTYT